MELTFDLNVSATHFDQDLSGGKRSDKINFGWESTRSTQSICYDVDDFTPTKVGKTVDTIRDHMPYMTQRVIYKFSSEREEKREPVTLVSADIDKLGKLHLYFQVVPGEGLNVELPVDVLSKAQLKNIRAGSTWYSSMEFDD